VLTAQNNVVKYVYPMKTEMISSKPLSKCTVRVNIISDKPLVNIYSPTHKISIKRIDDYHAEVAYYDTNVLPDQDFILYYSVSALNIGVDLLAYTESGTKNGYFIMMAAPQFNIPQDDVQPKDIVFVLDTSGSMAGDKIKQAKAALEYCLHKTGKKDRFNIVSFSNNVSSWKTEMKTINEENILDADKYINNLNAGGGTNINEALKVIISMLNASTGTEKRLKNVIFITDGQPTVDEINTNKILSNVKEWNKNNVCIYNFGVGADYNAPFLDELAEENNGVADNVLPKDDIEKKVAEFYNSISSPVFTNIHADWGTTKVFDIFPDKIPNIYKGSQIIMTGRYKTDGDVNSTLKLTGLLAGKDKDFKYNINLPSATFDDENIPKLWATRKVGYLENQLRLKGINKEILNELIDLSMKYGIISQYTSFLIDVDNKMQANQMGSQQNIYKSRDAQVADAYKQIGDDTRTNVGMKAVRQSYNGRAYNNAAQIQSRNTIMNDRGEMETVNQMRNVSQRSFVQNGKQWIDVNYQNQKNIIKVKSFSPAYFQLANAHPQMQQYLSMGNDVVIAVQDTAIQIGDDGIDKEFTEAEFKPIVEKMNAEFITTNKQANHASLINIKKGNNLIWPIICVAIGLLFIRRKKVAA
jgi:Ca-activated chloride channel family protein